MRALLGLSRHRGRRDRCWFCVLDLVVHLLLLEFLVRHLLLMQLMASNAPTKCTKDGMMAGVMACYTARYSARYAANRVCLCGAPKNRKEGYRCNLFLHCRLLGE